MGIKDLQDLWVHQDLMEKPDLVDLQVCLNRNCLISCLTNFYLLLFTFLSLSLSLSLSSGKDGARGLMGPPGPPGLRGEPGKAHN